VGDRPDNRNDDRRPASWLVPATGVQALVDVQRRGLLAAGDLVDRLIRSVDGDGDERGGRREDVPAGAAAARPQGGPSPAVGATEDLMRLWVDVVRLGLDAFGQFLAPGAGAGVRTGQASVDLATGASTGVVRLEVVRRSPSSDADGGRAVGGGVEVWLHNGTGQAYAGLALHCGDLRASDGGALPSTTVQFDPHVLDLPARSSRGVVVSVDADVPPATYRGVILATGVPDVWLPIEVAVAAQSTET
jgi:hypothetical protein